MEESRKDEDGNIYKVTRDEEGKARSVTRENDGMLFYVTKDEDGTFSLISEEEDRKIKEESEQATEEYYKMLDEVGGDPLDLDIGTMVMLDNPDKRYIRSAGIKQDKLYLDEDRTKIRYTCKYKYDGHTRDEIFLFIKPTERLSDIITKLPYGLIDKQVTGIGATYLELYCNRNSIIVTPTRTLAWNKWKQNENKFLYVGTKEGTNKVTSKIEIKAYLNREDIRYKKILVVADSLETVINTIREGLQNKDDVYRSYFLLVDEIDTLQSDNHYRPVLSKVIDYYFKFKLHHRALLSATVREFTYPKLQDEPVTTIEAIEKPKREIHVHYTDNIISLLSAKIVEITEQHPDKKILVAYNSVINIRQTINSLETVIPDKETFSILCSEASRVEAGGYFKTLDNENKLPCKINFMTSTYFTGIDIEDSYHLITVCDSRRIYTALTINKIIQIYGRCRVPDGILSDTIIYNNTKRRLKDLGTYRNMLINQANKVIALLKAADNLKQGDEDVTDLFDRIHKVIIEKATEILFHEQSFELTRETIDKELEISHFNIDALHEKMEAYYKCYSYKEGLYNQIKTNEKMYHTIHYHVDNSPDDKNDDDNSTVAPNIKEDNNIRLQQQLSDIKNELVQYHKDHRLNDDYLDEKIRSNKGKISEYYKRFKKYCKYYDVEFLSNIFAEIALMNKKAYRNLNNTLIFRAFEDAHPFKAQVIQNFKIGVKYSSEEIADILNTIIKDQHFKTMLSHPYTLRNHFDSFVDNTYTGGKYRVRGFKPKYNGIEIPEPLKRISKNVNAIDYFEI